MAAAWSMGLRRASRQPVDNAATMV